MKFNYLFLLLLIGAFLITACGDEEEPEPNPVCNSNNMTYTEDISSIFNSSCATSGACHASGSLLTFPLSNYDESALAAGFGQIVGAINHDVNFLPMPYPRGTAKLDQCLIDKITSWIADGAPE